MRVRNGEAVIPASIPLHVEAGGHVARYALVARASQGMVAVGNRIDNRSLLQAGSVAAHAKRIVLNRQDSLMRMGVVAIQAADTLVPHSTHLKRSENVVLFLSLIHISEPTRPY